MWGLKKLGEKIEEFNEKVKDLETSVKLLGAGVKEVLVVHKLEKAMEGVHQRIIDDLREQVKDLHDRLAARTYPELKTFKIENISDEILGYEATEDPDLSGSILTEDELHDITAKGNH